MCGNVPSCHPSHCTSQPNNYSSNMPQFKFKNGKTLDFEEFPISEKNLRKVNIYRDGKDSEGVWAAFSDEGVKVYDSKRVSKDYEGVCILQNDALHFYPHGSWGLYVPLRFHGASRATLDLADMGGYMLWCEERKEANRKANRKADEAKKAEKAKKENA